jgi:hypothetical protein
MPRVIDCGTPRGTSLAECGDALDASGFDPRDETSLIHAADWLARLGANQDFLGDLLVAELAQRHREDVLENGYSVQVVMLRPPQGDYFIRANIWPSAAEAALRASGAGTFAYGMAHDHNFDFLTHGYFGPGYWSDYYEYDHAAVTGWRGEPVPSLEFIERSRLSPGKLMHYRAHLDVHAQHPPDSLSVSLNVMHSGGAAGWVDQYAFDLGGRRIAGHLGAGASEALLRIAVASGSGEGRDLAERFALHHPSDRMRLCAWTALASASDDPVAVWGKAEEAGSRLVAQEAWRWRTALG